jgi:MbtH protein
MAQDTSDTDSGLEYSVVVNHEEQYSIWPADRDLPAGWRPVGVQGTRSHCLEHIARVWTDMRPASVRQRMDGDAGD